MRGTPCAPSVASAFDSSQLRRTGVYHAIPSQPTCPSFSSIRIFYPRHHQREMITPGIAACPQACISSRTPTFSKRRTVIVCHSYADDYGTPDIVNVNLSPLARIVHHRQLSTIRGCLVFKSPGIFVPLDDFAQVSHHDVARHTHHLVVLDAALRDLRYVDVIIVLSRCRTLDNERM